MVILRRLSDWDYNPQSKDGLDYEDCQEVPALPDQEGVCSYTLYVPSQRCERKLPSPSPRGTPPSSLSSPSLSLSLSPL